VPWAHVCHRDEMAIQRMSEMAIQRMSLNVSLTPELARFIVARVASGRYQTASEVVRAALRLLEQSDSRQDQPSLRKARAAHYGGTN
jgi:putative addiction module CopG family antidote